jgi:signal peptidase II
LTRTAGWALALATMGLVVAVDQATKAWAVAAIERGEQVNVFLGIDLTYVRNTGVAFGFLSGGGWPITALTVTALVLLLAYFAVNARRPLLWLPVGMVIGGALGNLADRAREGAVIDFIDPMLWPAFNLADAFIVVGILVLFWVIEGYEARGQRAESVG